MRRLLPAVVLVGTAFLVAELLPGSAPITQPLLWPFLLLIYGPGALLIRESVRRLDRGWASILLLGAAYGIVEEGLALQSLFNPSLYSAADWGARIFGVNGVYAEAAIMIHAVWSAAVPILFTDLLFPDSRAVPYLRRIGFVLTGIWYLLGVSLLAALTRLSIAPGYEAPPSHLAMAALVALLLVVTALVVLPRNSARPKPAADAPQPRLVLLVTFTASVLWHALLAVLWRIEPAFADWPLFLVPVLGAMAVAASMDWGLRQWTARRGWNDRHRLALVSGAVISHSLVGGIILTKSIADRVGVGFLGLVLIVLLILFANRLRERVQHVSGAHPEGVEPPTHGSEVVLNSAIASIRCDGASSSRVDAATRAARGRNLGSEFSDKSDANGGK